MKLWTSPHAPMPHPEEWKVHETGEPTFRYEVRYHHAGIAKFCYRWDAEAFIKAAIEYVKPAGNEPPFDASVTDAPPLVEVAIYMGARCYVRNWGRADEPWRWHADFGQELIVGKRRIKAFDYMPMLIDG